MNTPREEGEWATDNSRNCEGPQVPWSIQCMICMHSVSPIVGVQFQCKETLTLSDLHHTVRTRGAAIIATPPTSGMLITRSTSRRSAAHACGAGLKTNYIISGYTFRPLTTSVICM